VEEPTGGDILFRGESILGYDAEKTRVILTGDVPSPIAPPPGCRFHTRCIYTKEVCMRDEPLLREVRTNHFTACHFAEELPAANGSI